VQHICLLCRGNSRCATKARGKAGENSWAWGWFEVRASLAAHHHNRLLDKHSCIGNSSGIDGGL
jgi:hypothetical protein